MKTRILTLICGIILTCLTPSRDIANAGHPIALTNARPNSSETWYMWCFAFNTDRTRSEGDQKAALYSYIFTVTVDDEGDHRHDEEKAYNSWLAELLRMKPIDFKTSCLPYPTLDSSKKQKTASMSDVEEKYGYKPVQMGYPENAQERKDDDY